ncbi:MAG: glycoside hydrolase family 2 [Ruminococcaceae bacterium]|nr:glycoside hydrolase family 2 [Oscillospiraceae bacterium]
MQRFFGEYGWEKQSLDGSDWKLAYAPHSRVCVDGAEDAGTIAAVKALGYPTVDAVVPGNFELDLLRAGEIEDPFFGTNPIKLQRLECLHLFYYRRFDTDFCSAADVTLELEGVDTFADVWLNGEKIAALDNMLIAHSLSVGGKLRNGGNELLVHISPATIAARRYEAEPGAAAFSYNHASLYVRKAPASYGWDIAPRFVSGGLWRSVSLVARPKERIKDVFCYTKWADAQTARAGVAVWYAVETDADLLDDLTVEVEGICGENRFGGQSRLWHTSGELQFGVSDCRLWWPRNYGAADLYDVTVTLRRGETVLDRTLVRMGIRTVALDRTGTTDTAGNGEFCFRVNGRRIFALGTNWVPVDAFHSRDRERLPQILPMLSDLGCNMVRCWGGNVYEDDLFFEYCDENGIMVWQDFAMGCAVYPQDEAFLARFAAEAEAVVRRLRNHASLSLWAGDNECDMAYAWNGRGDPNNNRITREVIPRVLDRLDFTRPYLPSSPYVDAEAYASGAPTSEDHLWGPRDYFKGPYYTSSVCHFASETGYHGCPSVASLEKFISADQLWPWSTDDREVDAKPDWLAHAASPELNHNGNYAYRIRLMADQVKTLFGSTPATLADFSAASQISQAEAKKFFIERFRIGKWRRTGILWWNLIDGWPQISDAVVDYYYDKKLAYDYIKRSQQPLCLMFDEPDAAGEITLVAVNDLQKDCAISYRVSDALSGETIAAGETVAAANTSAAVCKVPTEAGEQRFYRIEWTSDGTRGDNHFMTGLKGIDLASYRQALQNCGFRSV